ncbi:MAG: FAD-binding domain-containing protein [Rhodoluna sp.]
MEKIGLSATTEGILDKHFAGLHSGGGKSSIRGGQTAADQALSALDITRYAADRSEVLPLSRRGATVLSPFIRHNLLTLKQVWDAVSDAPWKDREKFRDELLWQEYARHLYARIGVNLFENLRFEQVRDASGDGWNRDMACIDLVVGELERDGWLVNQTRMWLASHWTVRNGRGWIHGQERMYQNLLDGSRAANLLGWQWTVGSGGKPYGFARWQVEKRAPGTCFKCALKKNCPIQEFPVEAELPRSPKLALLDFDPDLTETTGPLEVEKRRVAKEVLLTIDSMGDADPALSANPDLPVVFVFNRPALRKLQLSSKRIHFYIETLQDLAERRKLTVYLGDPYEYAKNHDVAVTYAPVPSFRKFENLAEVHPFPWLRLPHEKNVQSFSSWRRNLD